MADLAPPSSGPRAGAPGRVSFFDEQVRRRRHATIWSGVTMLVAWLLGWVLGFLVLSAISFYVLLSRSLLPQSVGALIDQLAPNAESLIGPLVVGGLFFAISLWGVVRIIFGRDTSSAFLGRLGARLPNLADPEEKQLVNVVEEMAISAVGPIPRVQLFDGETINAAVLGADAEHATFLLSRRMLNVLDRDETQGVIAHLTASSINGDLQMTAGMLRVFYVLGLAVTILDLPFSRRAQMTFWDLLRYILKTGKTAADAEGESVAARLTESLQPEGLVAVTRFMQRLVEPASNSGIRKVVGALILMPLLPLIMIRIAAAILYGLLSLFILGPLVAVLLRSRRRLADATSVQLTRHPDGLACALVHLMREAHTVTNAGWAEMLFIVGPEASDARRTERLEARMQEIRSTGGGWKTNACAGLAATQDYAAKPEIETKARQHNFIFGFHPSLNSRINQLKRMGATKVQWADQKDYSGWILAAVVTFVVGIVVLLAIAGSRS